MRVTPIALLGLGLTACAPEPVAADWLGAPIAPERQACAGARAAPVNQTVALRLLIDEGASLDAMLNQTRRLRGFYEPYGLRFEVQHASRVSVGAPLDGDEPAAVLASLGRLIDEHAQVGVVTVALLPDLAAPGSPADRYFSELDGLTLSPALVADRPALAPLVERDAFGPLILLSEVDLAHRHPAHLDLTLAHELGHALGLLHEGDSDNLMHDGPLRCAPHLTDAQLAAANWSLE